MDIDDLIDVANGLSRDWKGDADVNGIILSALGAFAKAAVLLPDNARLLDAASRLAVRSVYLTRGGSGGSMDLIFGALTWLSSRVSRFPLTLSFAELVLERTYEFVRGDLFPIAMLVKALVVVTRCLLGVYRRVDGVVVGGGIDLRQEATPTPFAIVDLLIIAQHALSDVHARSDDHRDHRLTLQLTISQLTMRRRVKDGDDTFVQLYMNGGILPRADVTKEVAGRVAEGAWASIVACEACIRRTGINDPVTVETLSIGFGALLPSIPLRVSRHAATTLLLSVARTASKAGVCADHPTANLVCVVYCLTVAACIAMPGDPEEFFRIAVGVASRTLDTYGPDVGDTVYMHVALMYKAVHKEDEHKKNKKTKKNCLRWCHNDACANLSGPSDLALKTFGCRGVGCSACYCCLGCAEEAWRAGHRGVCGRPPHKVDELMARFLDGLKK